MFSLETREKIVDAIANVLAIPLIPFVVVYEAVCNIRAVRAARVAEMRRDEAFSSNYYRTVESPYGDFRPSTRVHLRFEDGTYMTFSDEEELFKWQKSRDFEKRMVKAKEEADKKCFL